MLSKFTHVVAQHCWISIGNTKEWISKTLKLKVSKTFNSTDFENLILFSKFNFKDFEIEFEFNFQVFEIEFKFNFKVFEIEC